MDHFFRSEDAHAEMRRAKKLLKKVDFCWNWTSLLWDLQALASLMRQVTRCSVNVLDSEVTDQKGFCPCF